MASSTPQNAAASEQPSGSHSAPVIVSDRDSPPLPEDPSRQRSLQSLPAPEPPTVSRTPTTSTAGIKRPAPFDPAELARLRLKNHRDTRRKQRDQYFDTLAKEADAMGNLPSSPRRICNEDDLEKLELKRCFELLHAMGRASDPRATVEATRASIGGFLHAIFQDWDTTVAIPAVPGASGVEANAPAGRICDYPNEHGNIQACLQSNTCITQVRACASYNNQAISFTFYKVPMNEANTDNPVGVNNMNNTNMDEARYQAWLNQPSSGQYQSAERVNISNPCGTAPVAPMEPTGAASANLPGVAQNAATGHSNTNNQQPPKQETSDEETRIDPLTHPNVKIQHNWREVLKTRLHQALLKRMHEQNKHRAIWIVRHMVVDWENGAGVKVEEDWAGDCWGFIRSQNIQEIALALI